MHSTKTVAFVSALAAGALASPIIARESDSNNTTASSGCFPYGGVSLPRDYSAPSVSRDEWWCPGSQQYGFQGFSYPLESDDCSDASNSFDQMNKDFAQMKKDFGASMVRLYYPACTEASVFENALKAGVANDLAVVPQIWFGFDGDSSVKTKSTNALYSVMTGKYAKVAPYVFHSADFGSEPIGDGVDDGNDNFASDLGKFRSKMNGYGVPVGISEDWDRPGTMSSKDGKSLGSIGKKIKANSDVAHAHVMPYYHGNLQESDAWAYIEPQLHFLHDVVSINGTMVTETQWAWGDNSHYGGHHDVGPKQYAAYWSKFDAECELFKQLNIGWFIHDWQGEETFDMKKQDGSYEMEDFKPRKC